MSWSFGVVLALGVTALVGGAGCEGDQTLCGGACITAGAIVDQTTLPSPIVSLTADAPCTVQQLPLDGGTQVLIGVDGPGQGSCQIRETLADGSTWIAVLTWEPVGGTGCCASSTHNVGPPPMFTRGNSGTP